MDTGKKQAFLIMAHSHMNQLKLLISLLDDPLNDIYVHVDAKCRSFNEVEFKTNYSQLVFISRGSLTWGAYNLVECELCLLKEAVKYGPYAYYHLISGQDLPIKTNKEIQTFFSGTDEYISGEKGDTGGRAKYYYFFQDKTGRNFHQHRSVLAILEWILLYFQRALGLFGFKRRQPELFKGNQWFSITENMARYLVGKEKWIRQHFHHTLCPDEFALQTTAYYSPYVGNISERKTREIDWQRGGPYVFKTVDFELLKGSEAFFARKFDEDIDNNIICLLSNWLRQSDC